MTHYDQSQTGWPIILIVCGLILLFAGVYAFIPELQTVPWAWLPGIGILVLTLILFYRGRVTVDNSRVRFSFGPGLISKSVPLSDIESCKVVSHSFIKGFGIRRTKAGWLYNVSGNEAVEITLNSGKKVLFGSDEPKRLATAIMKRVEA